MKEFGMCYVVNNKTENVPDDCTKDQYVQFVYNDMTNPLGSEATHQLSDAEIEQLFQRMVDFASLTTCFDDTIVNFSNLVSSRIQMYQDSG
jgi:hypothetical protein